MSEGLTLVCYRSTIPVETTRMQQEARKMELIIALIGVILWLMCTLDQRQEV